MSSKLNMMAPFSPLISRPFMFWLPVAKRVASKVATAPPLKRARKRVASSTSTLPFLAVPPAAPAAVPVPDGGEGFFVLAGGVAHLAGIVKRTGQWLFTRYIFAGLEGGDGHLGVGVVGAGDIDEVDVGVGDGSLPVGFVVAPAPAVFEGFELLGISADDGVHHRLGWEVEKLVNFEESVAVGAAHELVADQADICH